MDTQTYAIFEGSRKSAMTERARGPTRTRRAKVIPFPLASQHPLVVKIAAQMAAELLPARAEKLLKAKSLRRIDALHRQGLSDRAVERQIRAFESAGRAELWRIV